MSAHTCPTARRSVTGSAVAELTVNILLPFVIYTLLEPRWGDMRALLASSAPPILWSLAELVRHRRVDALAWLTIAGIALALLALVGGGSVRWLQLREKLATGLIGLALVGSVLLGKPLMGWLMEASVARAPEDRAARFRAVMALPVWPRAVRAITLVWGVGLLADVALSAALIFSMPIATYLVIGPLFGYAVVGALSLWTWAYAKRLGLNGLARSA